MHAPVLQTRRPRLTEATHVHVAATHHDTILSSRAHLRPRCTLAPVAASHRAACMGPAEHTQRPTAPCSAPQGRRRNRPATSHKATPHAAASLKEAQPRRQPLSAAPKSDDLGIAAPFTAHVESSSIRLRSSSPAPHRRPVGVTLHQHVACTREQRQGARGRQARFVAAVCACGRGLQGGWECHGWCCSKHT